MRDASEIARECAPPEVSACGCEDCQRGMKKIAAAIRAAQAEALEWAAEHIEQRTATTDQNWLADELRAKAAAIREAKP